MRRSLWAKGMLAVLALVMVGVSACARLQGLRPSADAQAPAAATAAAGQSLPLTGEEQEYVSVAEEIDQLFRELEANLNRTDTLADLQ